MLIINYVLCALLLFVGVKGMTYNDIPYNQICLFVLLIRQGKRHSK